MYIQSENLSITEGSTYILKKIEDGNAYSGIAYIISPTEYYNSFTDDEFTGELTITKFDMENYIVSGTFWFDVQHPVTGERVKIRDGRFDAQFGL
ncbi:DUF6252 family protein [Flavobacterium beibuense]|uniref:Putative lipoprotein n=1 Tax=Flavobacterium beibuense TaxID=657326 RepID=A0A444W7M1_9FLAO|nr:DUF6252 family protein [Flavobacterium beibuense]RYJ41783.1 putative lipoprotein [Flavobacterium beibuense]